MPRKAATKAVHTARVDELLHIRLDGAEFWDAREYVREKEKEADSVWFIDSDVKPLSDSQLRRYLQAVDEEIAESNRASRRTRLRKHLAQRRNLYGKAVSQGDTRAALAVLQDLAKLEGLYPQPPNNAEIDKLIAAQLARIAGQEQAGLARQTADDPRAAAGPTNPESVRGEVPPSET